MSPEDFNNDQIYIQVMSTSKSYQTISKVRTKSTRCMLNRLTGNQNLELQYIMPKRQKLPSKTSYMTINLPFNSFEYLYTLSFCDKSV